MDVGQCLFFKGEGGVFLRSFFLSKSIFVFYCDDNNAFLFLSFYHFIDIKAFPAWPDEVREMGTSDIWHIWEYFTFITTSITLFCF